MPSAFSPQSATTQFFETEMTVESTLKAWTNGSPSLAYAVSIKAYDPACISVTHLFMSYVPVPPPEMTSPPTSLWARASCPIETSIISSRVARLSSPTMCPSYPITPRTTSPAARARSASRPASSGAHPQRGSPTFTSMRTSATPPWTATSIVASESTANVTRAPRLANAPSRLASATSLANSKSSPSPASAMPSISRMVAQVQALFPSAAWRAANAVHLCALTWGRSCPPGNASAIVRRLASRRPASTTNAGVVNSESFTVAEASERPPAWPGARSGARVLSAFVSTPWLGDACGLVDAFRAGELSPTEALDDCIAAIHKSPLNAFSFTDFERARDAAVRADVSRPFGGVPFGVKELEKVAGWPDSRASIVFRDRLAGHDDTSVVRLRSTGALLAAQTTAPEFGLLNCTSSVLHGTTRNPWNQERTPGGSSGGTAAAVAGGLLPIATGS